MNNSVQNLPSKITITIAFVSLWIIGICLFAISEDRFYPMTKAYIYQNIGYYTGFGEQQKPEFSIVEVSKIDLVFGEYRILQTPSNYFRVVRHLSEIPEADDYKIRMISLSDSTTLKTAAMVNLMNGIDVDGSPVEIRIKSITLRGDSDEK